MGNAESQPVRNVDKRTARRDFGPQFRSALARYRYEHGQPGEYAHEPAPPPEHSGQLRVAVRRRPIFLHETSAGEFDVLTCSTGSCVTVHDCRMPPDCRRLFVAHHSFAFDAVYDEAASSSESCHKTSTNPTLHPNPNPRTP